MVKREIKITFNFADINLMSAGSWGNLLISYKMLERSGMEGGSSARAIAWLSRLICDGCYAIFLQSWFIFELILYTLKIIIHFKSNRNNHFLLFELIIANF